MLAGRVTSFEPFALSLERVSRFAAEEPFSLLHIFRLCEADSSPALWAAPFSKEARVNRILAKTKIPSMSIIPRMQPLGEGARQRRRMDTAQPRNLNSLFQISTLLSSSSSAGRFRLSEADPSPALRAAPFSKGARGDRFLAKANIPTMNIIPRMQPLGEGARQRRRMDCRKAAVQLKAQGKRLKACGGWKLTPKSQKSPGVPGAFHYFLFSSASIFSHSSA